MVMATVSKVHTVCQVSFRGLLGPHQPREAGRAPGLPEPEAVALATPDLLLRAGGGLTLQDHGMCASVPVRGWETAGHLCACSIDHQIVLLTCGQHPLAS